MKFGHVLLLLALLSLILAPLNARANTAPVVRQSASQFASAGTSHVINLIPAGMAPGDFTVLCVQFNSATGTITYPTGWLAATITTTTTDLAVTGFCLYRVYVAGDPTTVTVTTANSVQSADVLYQVTGATVVYRDFGGSSGFDTNPDPPALTVSPQDAVLVIAALFFGNNDFCHVTSYPSGFGSDIVASTDDGSNAARAAMSTRSEVIGTEDPGAATISTVCRWVTHTFAIGGPPTVLSAGLSDVQIIVIAMFMLSFTFLFALGIRINPIFLVLSGVVGIVFSFVVQSDTDSTELALIVVGISLLVMVMGIFSKTEAIG